MIKKWLAASALMSMLSVSLIAEECSDVLSFESGKKIKSSTVAVTMGSDNHCKHKGKYENGEIVTELGMFTLSAMNENVEVGGEQTVTVYDASGTVSFVSTSNEWELQGKHIVHHHEGFDVLTKKKSQYVVSK